VTRTWAVASNSTDAVLPLAEAGLLKTGQSRPCGSPSSAGPISAQGHVRPPRLVRPKGRLHDHLDDTRGWERRLSRGTTLARSFTMRVSTTRTAPGCQVPPISTTTTCASPTRTSKPMGRPYHATADVLAS